MSLNTFNLHILATDKPFYEGECVSLVVPTLQGQYGIMAHHSNYISAVIPGEIDFTILRDGKEVRVQAAVSDGLVKVENNEVLVLVDTAESPGEIDENRAKRAADAAKEELLRKQTVREYYAAQAKLARAMNRLKVKKHTLGND